MNLLGDAGRWPLAAGGTKAATINRKRAAIGLMHTTAGLMSPTTHEAVKGTVNTVSTAPGRKRPAALAVVMNAAVRASTVSHIRNELVASGARVMGAEIGQRTVFAESKLYGSSCLDGQGCRRGRGRDD